MIQNTNKYLNVTLIYKLLFWKIDNDFFYILNNSKVPIEISANQKSLLNQYTDDVNNNIFYYFINFDSICQSNK